MLERTPEPEVMDTDEEVSTYDAMDHSKVNARFAEDFLAFHGPCQGGEILDVGTGTALIPIEIARRDSRARIVAVDLASRMIARARHHVETAGLSSRIRCEVQDAKAFDQTQWRHYEAVISNSIVHHLADPRAVLAAMAGMVAPGGTLFVRDLVRPDSEEQVNDLVETYAADEPEFARALFGASLRAAFTLAEIDAMRRELGLTGGTLVMSSDRHWTWSWRRDP